MNIMNIIFYLKKLKKTSTGNIYYKARLNLNKKGGMWTITS